MKWEVVVISIVSYIDNHTFLVAPTELQNYWFDPADMIR